MSNQYHNQASLPSTLPCLRRFPSFPSFLYCEVKSLRSHTSKGKYSTSDLYLQHFRFYTGCHCVTQVGLEPLLQPMADKLNHLPACIIRPRSCHYCVLSINPWCGLWCSPIWSVPTPLLLTVIQGSCKPSLCQAPEASLTSCHLLGALIEQQRWS